MLKLTYKTEDETEGKNVIAFDLDGTIIGSIRETVHVNPIKLKMIRDLSTTNHIIIFTNQMAPPKDLKDRLSSFIELLDIPIQIYVSCKKDKYRKPCLCMWNEYLKTRRYPPATFTFVGDAAGRATDHSNSDLEFATNIAHEFKAIAVDFKTPEEFFTNCEAKDIIPADLSLLLLVGYPASGKSTLSSELTNFEIVSRDILKTPAKCLKKCRELLEGGKKVIIDNLNTNTEARLPYIQLAKTCGVRVGCLDMNVGMLEAMKRNEGRDTHVPKIVFYTFRKNYISPSLDENADWVGFL